MRRDFLAIATLVTVALVGCGNGGGTPVLDGGGMRVDGGGGRDGGTFMCPAGRTSCDGTCYDLQTNPANCGSCGTACASDETCESGSCRPMATCPDGQEDCGGGCVDVSTSAEHCGRCGNPCDTGETCMDASCQPETCPSGQERCGAACTDTQTDNANCGACDAACDIDEMCVSGMCRPACPSGQTACDVMDPSGMGMMSVCVDTMTDASHCGMCNDACPTGQSCTGGACECPAMTTDCGGTCVNTDTDTMNCGSCGRACPMEQSCEAGDCVCPTGLTDCSGTCVNTDVDAMNCGTCGMVCGSTETCVGGSCMPTCAGGRVLCGATCVDPRTDNMNCGGCGVVCGAGTRCGTGVCRPSNDRRGNATRVMLPAGGGEATVMGTTTDATRDGPTISGCAANGPNVWYSVVLPSRGVLWIDTAGSMYDTAIFITDSAGAAISATGGTNTNPGLCNDDCGCPSGGGGFTSALQSCGGAALPAGTYNISVGGFSTASTGDFTLHVQFMPETGFLYGSRLTGLGTTTDTLLIGTSEADDMCAGGFSSRSGEDMRWFASCGGTDMETFSLCASDGGSYERANGTSDYDPVMYVWSGQSGAEVACNDDGPVTLNCRGTGGDSANFGSRLGDITAPRGVNAVFIDSRGLGGSGMNYQMRYDVPTTP